MGYIKAEYGKNNMFELDIEVKDCNSIECLSFATGVAEEILNCIAKDSAKTLIGYKRAFIGYKRALIGAIENAEPNDYE
jgi:hypothetical protein|nr:MAG TPA: hypothetical protein [Caudoviricetes sp.]